MFRSACKCMLSSSTTSTCIADCKYLPVRVQCRKMSKLALALGVFIVALQLGSDGVQAKSKLMFV